jgi:thiol-disulfide isomerase/thioredoxin
MPDSAPDTPRAARPVRAPEFPPAVDWPVLAGAPAPPTLAALRGRVVLLDLWTAGCINCQHVAPELRALERAFGPAALGAGGLAVLGVHAGPFVAERQPARIAHAAARLGVDHPVANDRQFRVWRAWAARGWPTLAVVDAAGRVAFQHAGERSAAELAPLVAALLAEGGGRAGQPAPNAGPHARPAAAPATAVRYPAAVALWAEPPGDGSFRDAPSHDAPRRLAVADAGHHRVLVGRLTPDGRTLRVDLVAGAGARTRDLHPAHWGDDALPAPAPAPAAARTRAAFAARADGAPDRATFDRPQGLAFSPDGATLFVADTGDHAVRAVDLATGRVRTLAGTGVRRRTREDRAAGAMASPWGLLALGDGALLVGMAGTHELWRVDARTGDAAPVAGGRGEGLLDGAPPDALLAQPAGLATDGRRVWWADAEASAVRETTTRALTAAAPAAPDPVRTLVGTGLFDFGLADGVGDAARLQHPQALAWVPAAWGAPAPEASPAAGGRLLVADSYNDALRWLDPATRRVETWRDGFAEPGGVAVAPPAAAAGAHAYDADTNAHRVAVVDLRTGAVDTLAIVDARG